MQLKFATQIKIYNSILSVTSQSCNRWLLVLNFAAIPIILAMFTIELLGDETVLLFKFLDLNRK